jgi:hypothetical protein
MNSKVKALLTQLALTDAATSDFLDLSKKIAEAVRMEQKEKAEKPPNPPKPAKVLKKTEPKTKICDECYMLVVNKLNEVRQVMVA